MNIQKLKDEAKRAIGRKEVKYLIGYQKGSYGFRVSPVFIESKDDLDRLTLLRVKAGPKDHECEEWLVMLIDQHELAIKRPILLGHIQ